MVDYIGNFLEMMSAERGAAENTLESYQHDLEDFRSYLKAAYPETAVEHAIKGQLQSYLSNLTARGLSSSTTARRLSSHQQLL